MDKRKQFPENGRDSGWIRRAGFYVLALVVLASLALIYMTNYTVGLICTLFAGSIFLLYLLERLQRKISVSERLCLLLEQFSDTVLFEYDCIRDVLRFTSNAGRLFAAENVKLDRPFKHEDS